MKQIIKLAIVMIISINCFGQNNLEADLIKLAKIYKQNHGWGTLDNRTIAHIETYKDTKLETVANTIKELCTKKNNILDEEFIYRPDSITLKYFHTIIMINFNMFDKKPKDNKQIAMKYLNKDVSVYEQIMHYYSSIFTSITNKHTEIIRTDSGMVINKSLDDLSHINWYLDDFGFKDETEEAIFFLVFIKFKERNIVPSITEPKYEFIYESINKLPKINSKPYYYYQNFFFKDVKMNINKRKQSFKKYYLKIYYNLLLTHYFALVSLKKPQSEVYELLLSSILKDRNYYKYCDNKDILKDIFKKQ